MASVTLTSVWIHDASDYGANNYVKLDDAIGLDVSAAVSGNVFEFSTGRRWISSSVNWQDIDIVAVHVLRTDVDTLQGYIGRLLILRDPTGRQVWGIASELSIKESAETELSHVNEISFTFEETLGTVEV